jgi:peptide/nickel transport system substrate-binding protein
MRKTTLYRILAILAVFALVVAACGDDDEADTTTSGAPTPTTAGPSPTAAGTNAPTPTTPEPPPTTMAMSFDDLPEITLAVSEDPETLQSAHARQASRSTILRNIHEPLIDKDPLTAEFIPALATSWEQVDPLTWRFQLREGVVFHDGSPFNAEAAATGLSWVWSAENDFLIRSFVVSEMTFTAVSDYTLEVTSVEPDPLMLGRLWLSTIPSAKQVTEDPDRYVDTPVGTGPYAFVSWDRGTQAVVEANPDWWGLNSADGRGEINFSRVTFLIRPESSSRVAAFQANEVVFAEGLDPEACIQSLGSECTSAPKSDIAYIRLDTNNPVLADKRVRMAMSLAIDRATISETILGDAVPASQMVGPSVLGFNPDLAPHPFDMVQATALVAEARADGVPFDDFPLRLTILKDGFPGDAALQQVVLEAFRNIGIDNVTAEIQERDIFLTELVLNLAEVPPERGLMQMAQHNNRFGDMSSTIGLYLACGAVASTWCNNDAEALHEQAQPLSDLAARENLYQQYNALFYEDAPYVTIAQMPFFHGVSEDVVWQSRLDGVILLKDMS